MIPCLRPVFWAKDLNHDPSAARNVTGLVEELLNAFGLSLPRGERPMPQTKSELETPLIASYAAASARPQISADWFAPDLSHCGLTKRGWLHSFMTTNWLTVGNRAATAAAQAANCWIRVVLPQASGSLDGLHLVPPVSAIECAG